MLLARGKRAVAFEVPVKTETNVAVEMNLEQGMVGWAMAVGGGGRTGLGSGNGDGDELGCRGMGGGGECSLAGGGESLSGDESGTACSDCTTGISTEPMQVIPCIVIWSANTAVQGSPVMIPRNGRGSWQKVGMHCATGKPLEVAWAQGSLRQCTSGSFAAHCT